MRPTIIASSMVTAFVLAAGVQAGTVLAIGSKGEAVHPQDNKTNEKHFEGKGTGEGLSSKESVTQKKNVSPQKKPRLKYRDESKCSC
jgi:hypothetical protein